MIFLRKYSIYLLITILSFFVLAALMQPGFFSIHDDEQVGRLYELDQSIKDGHIPVRLSQNLGFGYGYALFNFYPSFVYYVAEVFVLLGIGYIASIELMIGLGFLLAGFFMYLFSKEYLNKWGALVAAVAYTYAPYHSVDVYVRGALPEFWSFVFIPAIFWAYKKLADTKKSLYGIIAGIFFCCLILTHNLVAMMSGLVIGIYVLFLFLNSKNKKHFLLWLVVSGFVGLGLSASFWIPSFFERNSTMIELLTKELADYNQHFVYIRQLWNSPWGYGGSLYGLEDGLSFEIGKLHIIGSILSLFVAVWLFVKKNIRWGIVLLFLFLFGISTLMITNHSKFIWDTLTFFAYIQFPWRFLLFSVFASSFLLGSLLLIFKSERLQIIAAAVLILATISLYKDYFHPDKYYLTSTDKDYTSLDVIKWKTSYMAFEYIPKGVATEVVPGNVTKIAITEKDVAKGNYVVSKGSMKVTEKEIKPQLKEFTTEGKGGILRLNQFAYPGWKVWMDGKEISYNANNKYKLIEFMVPPGNHTISARFTDTLPRILGNTITLTSILGMLLYIIVVSLLSNKRKVHEKHITKKRT